MSTTPPVDSRPPAGPAPDKSTFVRVRTTLPRLPFPPNSARQPILTPRLILRPPVEADLPAIHELRTQPEVMFWTATGRPDRDIEATRSRLEPFLPPKDEGTYNFAICDRESGAVIGLGGSHIWQGPFGWPEIGYMFRKEYWGRGLATEFLEAWLRAWEGLEREEVEIEVDPRSVQGAEEGGEGSGRVREQVVALTVAENGKSQRVLGKNGFEWFVTWKDKDMSENAAPDSTVDLPTFRYFPGAKKAE